MGRTHSIRTHPQKARIDSMIADSVPYSVIAREMGLAKSTVARYASLEKSELAKVVAEQINVTEVLARLSEVAEHARLLRLQSKLTGSPVAQSRAIKSESEILSRLLSELGIDDISVGNILEETRFLLVGIRTFVRTYPDSAADLIHVLAENQETKELANTFRSLMRKTA